LGTPLIRHVGLGQYDPGLEGLFVLRPQRRVRARREQPCTLSSDHLTGEISLGKVEGFRCAVGRFADPREFVEQFTFLGQDFSDAQVGVLVRTAPRTAFSCLVH